MSKLSTKPPLGLGVFIVTLVVSSFVGKVTIGQDTTQKLTAEYLFRTDRITDIKIQLPKEDWDHIRLQSRSFGEALGKEIAENPFTYVKADIEIDGVSINNVGIRKKGFLGSLNDKRPSLKIKFEEYVKQSPVKGLDRLTLNNNNQDEARVGQLMTYKLYRDSGTISPRCGLAKVTVNGDYLGIYSNVEPIKKYFLKYGFGDSSGALFEGTVADFMPDWTHKFETKNDAAKLSLVNNVCKAFDEDKTDLEYLKSVIDTDAFIRFWAMESLIGFWDGYCSNQNNFFLYQNPKNNKFYFIPWGTDSAYTDTIPIPPYMMRPKSVHAKAIIPNRLYRIDETKKQYTQTLMKFLDEHWQEEKLLAEIDGYEKLLIDHVLDPKRFKRRLAEYRRFIKLRREAIMEEFEEGPPKLLSKELSPIYFKPLGKATIQFKTEWYDKKPKDAAGLGEVSIEFEANGKQVEFTKLGGYASHSDRGDSEVALVFTGVSKSNGRLTIFGTGLSKSNFEGDQNPMVGGLLIQMGRFGFVGAKTKMLFGKVDLENASMEDGEPVSGTMQLSVVEIIGAQRAEAEE